MNANGQMDRVVYTVEDDNSSVITSHRTRAESLDAGELIAEFTPETSFYVVEHTLQ